VDSIIGTLVAFFGAFGITFVVEKSPIKINPLSMIKKFLVGDISEKIDNMDKKIEKVDKKVDNNELDRIRETILTYKKSMDMGVPITEHEYEYVLKIFDKYDKMGGNSFVADVVEEIKKMYHEQCEKNHLQKTINVV
jgi:hypothetical protein